jgi:hypothetical protein
MTRRVLGIVAAAALVSAVLVWLLVTGGQRPPDEPPPPLVGPMPTPTPAPQQQVNLLFTAEDGLLHPELRAVALPAETHERIRVLVNELLIGPGPGLEPAIPYPAELLGVYVEPVGHAFVDLSSPPAPLTGSHTELMLIYSVVNTILLNCPSLVDVQLLFSGEEIPTLTGHMDLSKPLALNKRFIVS